MYPLIFMTFGLLVALMPMPSVSAEIKSEVVQRAFTTIDRNAAMKAANLPLLRFPAQAHYDANAIAQKIDGALGPGPNLSARLRFRPPPA